MQITITPDELLAFEQDIADRFAAGEIKAPIHLSAGNESQLIEIFRAIEPWDWVLAGWRSHYHCLLKSVPVGELRAAILAGRSIALCFPKQKILCSAIVGGIAPIACGLAWAAKEKNDLDPTGNQVKVWCFIGDMTYETGITHESIKYATGHDLPVHWVIEDNGKSVMTDTRDVWKAQPRVMRNVNFYSFELGRPHSGIGKWVRF